MKFSLALNLKRNLKQRTLDWLKLYIEVSEEDNLEVLCRVFMSFEAQLKIKA